MGSVATAGSSEIGFVNVIIAARMMGRPSVHTAEVAAEICQRLADGETLREICRDERLPARRTVQAWVLDDHEGFSRQYARAREMQIEGWADEIVEISDDGTNDWQERQVGEDRVETVLNGEHVQRSKLRVDSRKWLLSKIAAHTYGDKTHLEHSGSLTLEQLLSQVHEKPKG